MSAVTAREPVVRHAQISQRDFLHALRRFNAAFTPSAAVVGEARQLVAEFADARKRGVYAFTFKGQMVDAPHLTRALKILARAGEPAPPTA